MFQIRERGKACFFNGLSVLRALPHARRLGIKQKEFFREL